MLTTESGVGTGAGVENANGTAVSPGSGDSFNWSSLTKLVFFEADFRIRLQIHQLHNIQFCVDCRAKKKLRTILHYIRNLQLGFTDRAKCCRIKCFKT